MRAPTLAVAFLSTLMIAPAQSAPHTLDEKALDTRSSDHMTCTTIYEPIKGSCNRLGYWPAGDSTNKDECKNWKCRIVNLLGTEYCQENPSCATLMIGWQNFCTAKQACVCDAGWASYLGKCREIMCEGKYVLNQSWGAAIPHGYLNHSCEGKDIVVDTVSCDRGYEWDGRVCYNSSL